MSSNRYTYGIIDEAPLDVDVTGVDGSEPIRTVDYRSLSAVVSEIETMEPERTDENATAHDEVLRAVLQSNGGRTVIPMRFGMVFKTDNALKNVLRNGRVAFRRSLNDLDGMVELGLKLVTREGATVDPSAVVEDVATRLREAADTERKAQDRPRRPRAQPRSRGRPHPPTRPVAGRRSPSPRPLAPSGR